MTRPKLLTDQDLIDELDMGKATLKFILHRFSPWLATQVVDNEAHYTEQAVDTLLKIKNFLNSGMLPEQIEESLALQTKEIKETAQARQPAENPIAIPVDTESASMFKEMLQVFIEKQDRIASAQEALAKVEERKADAMEKRAAAEEKKATAMTSIAVALQEMNQRHSAEPHVMEVAGRTVETLVLEETPEIDEGILDTSVDEDEHLFEDPVPMEDPFQDQDHDAIDNMGVCDIDDLSSLLVDKTALTLEDIDDLSSLIDSVSDPKGDIDNLESLLQESPTVPEINNMSDDLSRLVDSDQSSQNSKENEEDIDDLFSLVGMLPDATEEESNKNLDDLDDLSMLIPPADEKAVTDLDDLFALTEDPAQFQKPLDQEPLDDLSSLIESSNNENTGNLDDLSALIGKSEQACEPSPMDDLSMLVDGFGEKSKQATPGGDSQIDDLSSLVSDDAKSSSEQTQGPVEQSGDASAGMDNLSALIGNAPDTASTGKKNQGASTDRHPGETPSIKPDISPDQDMGKYKAAVMKIIIKLKGQGLTAQQTTARLNHDGVATMSGKPVWGLKALEKIYGFIDSAH